MCQMRNQRLVIHIFIVANFVSVQDGACSDARKVAGFQRSRSMVARINGKPDGLYFGRDHVAEELSGLRLSKVCEGFTLRRCGALVEDEDSLGWKWIAESIPERGARAYDSGNAQSIERHVL